MRTPHGNFVNRFWINHAIPKLNIYIVYTIEINIRQFYYLRQVCHYAYLKENPVHITVDGILKFQQFLIGT